MRNYFFSIILLAINSFVFSANATIKSSKIFAGGIDGPGDICFSTNPNTTYTFTVTGSTATSGFFWSVPSDATITSGAGTNRITVKFTYWGMGKSITVTGNGITATKYLNVYQTVGGNISGPPTVCKGQTEVEYALSPITGATQYTWGIPSGVGVTYISSTTNRIKLSFSSSFSGATIQAAGVIGSCGISNYASFTITATSAVPSAPGTISGAQIVTPGQTGVSYSVPPIANATNYNWNLPAGASVASGAGTNSITVNFSGTFTQGSITVNGYNSSCSGPGSAPLNLSSSNLPSAAGTIYGSNAVCEGRQYEFSVDPIPNATSYSWSVTGGATPVTNTLLNKVTFTITPGSPTFTLKVRGMNNFGFGEYSPPITGTIWKPTPKPSEIDGPKEICVPQDNVLYKVNPLEGVTGLIYTGLPVGVTPQNSSVPNEFRFNFSPSFTGGEIKIVGVNGPCGLGEASIISITGFQPPGDAGLITGSLAVCQGQNNVTYTIPVITNATEYVWTLVDGSTITTQSNSINVNYVKTAKSGSIAVYGRNKICSGNASSIAIAVNPIPVITKQPYISNRTLTSVAFTISATGSGLKYQWRKGGVNISGAIQATYTINPYRPSDAGNYSVMVTSDLSCSEVSSDIIFSVLKVTDQLNKNYIISRTITKNNVINESDISNLIPGEMLMNITYFDGLGRPFQNVNWAGAPSSSDLITPIFYDLFNRESRKYLPFVSGMGSGHYQSVTFDAVGNYTGVAANTYGKNPNGPIAQDTKPFAETIFESSPLNRNLKQGATGTTWQPDASTYASPTDKTIKFSYEVNAANEVLFWTYTYPTTTYPLGLVNAGTNTARTYYAINTLFKTKTKDEHNNEVIEFKDKLGRIVLKRIQASTTANDWADTYYIYDDFGSLITVIPPEAVRLITQATSSYLGQSDAIKNTFLNTWAFRYVYDAKRRMIEKQVPGAAFVSMVYDSRDRLVLSQDGNQRAKSEWNFVKYDYLNRPVKTGKYSPGATTRAALQTTVNGLGGDTGYQNADITAATDGAFPTVNTEDLTKTYYDSYTCSFCNPTDASNAYKFQTETWTTAIVEPFAYNSRVTGQVVATEVKVLNENVWLKTVNYYDYKYRPIQTVSSNYLGGYDRSSQIYDFAGRVLEKLQTPVSYTAGYTNIRDRFKYDHTGRLLKQYHKIGSAAEVLLANNTYNELGQLIDKKLHSNEDGSINAQSLDYRYNIRGWLTRINNSALNETENKADRFGMELFYTEGATIDGVSYPGQFNGNISAIKWRSNDGGDGNLKEHIYGYKYDVLNRLTEGKYASNNAGSWSGDAGMYDEVISSYDKNGNIKGLQRYGKINALRTAIDNLNYSAWTGNQVTRIDETGIGDKSFINKVSQAGEYLYDANGNMYKDLNKGITNIAYNMLNLPSEVTASATGNVKYTYTASGVKLKKTVTDESSVSETVYLGSTEYKDNTLSQIATAEGRVVPSLTTGGAFEYEYHLKDHLGNTRLAITTATKPAIAFDGKMEVKADDGAEGYTYTDAVRHAGDARTGSYSARLNGSQSTVLGPSISLKVSPGDKVNMEVFAKYVGSATHNTALAAFVKTSASAAAQTITEGPATTITTSINALPAISFTSATTVPRAYLNYIFFDEEFKYLSGESGYDIIDGTTQNVYEKLSAIKEIKKEGYLYIYVANESNANVNVFFDDFKVSLTEGQVLAKTDYYPFGGIIEGLSHLGASSRGNKYLYNGKELQDDAFGGVSLGMYDYGWRMYDPVVGRWSGLDPKAEKFLGWTPYNYCYNQPINVIDPDGQEGIVVSGQPGTHKNKEHFLANGLDRAQKAQEKRQNDNEKVTWVIYNDGSKENGHDVKQLEAYSAKAGELGIEVKVVSSADEIVDYVNEKTGGNSRAEDKITSFYYVGHATPGDLEVGYPDGDYIEPGDDFNSEAFASGAWINVVGGCRTAVDGDKIGEKSVVDQFVEIVDSKSTVNGANVRVQYDGGARTDQQLLEGNKGKIVTKKGTK